MAPGRRTIVSVRVMATLFFAATSVYCLIVASAFAYHQFIRPGLFGWLVWARNQYDALFLGVFSLTLLSLLPDLSQPSERASRWTRGATLGLVGLWGAAALALFVYPVLAVRISEERSLLLAALALIPVAWLAVIDHLACWRTVFRDHTVTVSSEKRIAAAGIAAALYVWARLCPARCGQGRRGGRLRLRPVPRRSGQPRRPSRRVYRDRVDAVGVRRAGRLAAGRCHRVRPCARHVRRLAVCSAVVVVAAGPRAAGRGADDCRGPCCCHDGGKLVGHGSPSRVGRPWRGERTRGVLPPVLPAGLERRHGPPDCSASGRGLRRRCPRRHC